MDFTDEQLARYSRHIVIDEISKEGQEKLLKSSVLIIGTGGLGSPAALYLAAAGIGTIGLADADTVDISNLQRQIVHSMKDLGRAKVQSAKEKLEAINSDITVKTYHTFVNSANILDIIKEYDFVIDATDNFAAKFLINDACVMSKKPFSHAGIIQFNGQIMTYVPEKGPCYRCIFRDPPPDGAIPSCKELGVVSAMGGIIGSMQAMEAIKYILGKGELFVGKMLIYDALKLSFRVIDLPHNTQNCPVCGKNPSITKLIDY